MPNRILRDWTDSEAIDQISALAERFFTRLIMKVDDYGRYNANPVFLKSTLFPLRTDIRETDITRWLAECEKSGLIALYNVASKGFVQILNFKQTLRQKQEKYPAPDMISGCVADDKQTNSICSLETKGNEKKRIEVEAPTDFASKLKSDRHFFEQVGMAWNLTQGIYETMINDFGVFLSSQDKVHPNQAEFKKHFHNWGKMKYSSYVEASKVSDPKLLNL